MAYEKIAPLPSAIVQEMVYKTHHVPAEQLAILNAQELHALLGEPIELESNHDSDHNKEYILHIEKGDFLDIQEKLHPDLLSIKLSVDSAQEMNDPTQWATLALNHLTRLELLNCSIKNFTINSAAHGFMRTISAKIKQLVFCTFMHPIELSTPFFRQKQSVCVGWPR